MNWRYPAMVLDIALALCISATGVAAAQESSDEPEMSAEAQAEMAAWMELAQPGEHHEHLQAYEGKWKTKIKMWMAPDAEPMLIESTAEAEWIMDGRFLKWQHQGDFAGSPYTGLAYDGYNNGDDRYETIYMDNFGTLMVFYTGECSDDGKTRVTNGSFLDPMAGVTIEQKNVYTWIDEDHFKYESFMKKGDEEYKNMEMVYER